MTTMLSKFRPFRSSLWDPEAALGRMERDMEKLFGRQFLLASPDQDETMAAAQWAPAVDVSEDDKEYLVKAELPELKKEDVKINVENSTLTISGERRAEKEEKGKRYHRIERSYGSFLRRFTMPEGVDSSKVAAEFKDGLLLIHLPKDEKAKPKSIEVKVQ
ncbi:MAG: Hsp20/alpha crystallin family protein [Verrucomicrobia bacterium]|nr:Hsp20/alpha crystallin family protein [Verrucomicrobiota bacterium]